ncbi:MAG: hypothetical protein ACPKPY_07980 [Nitrososphaeraceae archaeon]
MEKSIFWRKSLIRIWDSRFSGENRSFEFGITDFGRKLLIQIWDSRFSGENCSFEFGIVDFLAKFTHSNLG